MGWWMKTKKYQSPPRPSRAPSPTAGADGEVTRSITTEGRSAESPAWLVAFEVGTTAAAFVPPTPAPAEGTGFAASEPPPSCSMESFTLCEAWS